MPALLRLFSCLNKNSACSDEKDTYCLLETGLYLLFELSRPGGGVQSLSAFIALKYWNSSSNE